jgi:FtsP/CotA-like multicopper oxidase with cupredoxin domain
MTKKTTYPAAASQPKMGRRNLLKGAAATGAALAVGSVAMPARADRGTRRWATTVCQNSFPNELYPLSPLILKPFTEALPIPRAAAPVPAAEVATWVNQPGPGVGRQDSKGGTHQAWPGNLSQFNSIPTLPGMPQPIVYRARMLVGQHSYSLSPVRTLAPYRTTAGSLISAGTYVPRLPASTIYGFNGTFYGGVTIRAEYGQPILFRIENRLDLNPRNYDRGDYGSPELGFLCHLHNGHTAPESDGNPHHQPHGYLPGEWVDNLYLNYPAGGTDDQKMSSLWFHDHFHGHTGANVYKGMAGLYPIYDPKPVELEHAPNDPVTGDPLLGACDAGDETQGLRLPGVRTDRPDGAFDVDYDIPIVLHDVALDDGATPHMDAHNGCNDAQPSNWGKSYFRHFPDAGFVGDVFCVNGKAYPTLVVKRRKYRLRFLGASISRQWDVVLMRSPTNNLTAAVDMNPALFPPPEAGDETGIAAEYQGQWRLLDGQQCMRVLQIGNGGGFLPDAVVKDNVELWPAMRPQVVVDFTQYMDGTPTQAGQVIWLVNVCKMPNGRKADSFTRHGDLDPLYKVPMLKIVIGGDAPDASAPWWSPNWTGSRPQLRPLTPLTDPVLAQQIAQAPRRSFLLERGGPDIENQWTINDQPFDPDVPLVTAIQGRPERWTFETKGGWSHPMHGHQEEFRILTRVDGKGGDGLHAQDHGKDDVVELDEGEKVEIFRNFRSFTGKYVAHCHNLAHEDHAMMFGFVIAPPP